MASSSYSMPKYSSQPQSDSLSTQRLIQSISGNIQKIAQNVSQIENMNMQIGTLKDSESLRERLLQTENFTNTLAKETNKQLKELNTYVRQNSSSVNASSEDRQIKIQKERLTNDLVKTLNKFQEVQKLAMQKQRESNERAKANFNQQHASEEGFKLETMRANNQTGGSFDFDGGEMGSFENNRINNLNTSNTSQNNNNNSNNYNQMQLTMESDVNLTQLREREAALKRLENDIVDVNMIFKDLAVMVHDQGDIIDSIESNVEAVQIRVNEASNHLESAKKSQQKARKKKFILFSILAVVAAVIILLIILSIKSR